MLFRAQRYSLIASVFLFSTSLLGNDTFTDELSSDSIYLSPSTTNASIISSGAKLTFATSAVSGESSRARLDIAGETDGLEISFSIDGSSSFAGQDVSRLQIIATLFNDTQNGGFNEFEGDMVSGFQIKRTIDGVIFGEACIWRRSVDGSWQSSGFFNGSSCTSIGGVLTDDQQYTAKVSLDRPTGVLTYELGASVQSYAVTGATNNPSARQNFVTNRMVDLTGHMIVDIHGVKTDVIDTTTSGALALQSSRYQLQNDTPGESRFQWSAGEVRILSETDGTNSDQARMRILEPSDVLKARLKMDSDTNVANATGDAGFTGSVAGIFYNDTQSGGFNGLEGDVFATSEIVAESSGGLSAQYCAFRSTSANFSTAQGILNGGQDDCISFSLNPSYDTFYDLSVGLDLAMNRLLFSINGENAYHDIVTPLYESAVSNFQAVRATTPGGAGAGTTVIVVDKIETISTTLECNGKIVTVNLNNADSPTSGDDVILGTEGADTIVAMGGNDTICGLGGDDNINGGRGNDWIDAGEGNDVVLGANDDDEIYGGRGLDTLQGGPGDDTIHGEEESDAIKGNSGNDTLFGNDGIDQISGGSGNDTIYTGTGSNVGTTQHVTGGNGNDTIFGGTDSDVIRGEAGDDTIKGGAGDDELFGGGGEDDIDGESGEDLVRGNAADDVLKGGDGDDRVDGLGGKDIMYGGEGSDTLNGSTGDDTIFGEAGDDFLHGGGGNDVLDGGADADSCDGAGGIGDISIECETVLNVP